MSNELKMLERELAATNDRYQKAHDAMIEASRALDALAKKFPTLEISEVPAFVADTTRLEAEGPIYTRISADALEKMRKIEERIRELRLREIVAEKDRKATRREEIQQILASLPLKKSDERTDLEAELATLR